MPATACMKFYRAGRWSDAQIVEEHEFTAEMAAAELPVAAPLVIGGATLFRYQDYRFCVFPWMPGRAPELDAAESLALLGRAIARMHQIGCLRPFDARPWLTSQRLGWQAQEDVLASGLIPQDLARRYEEVSRRAAGGGRRRCLKPPGRWGRFASTAIVISAICSWNERGPVFVDLDDCMMGPRVQDLWMLLSGPARRAAEAMGGDPRGLSAVREFRLS